MSKSILFLLPPFVDPNPDVGLRHRLERKFVVARIKLNAVRKAARTKRSAPSWHMQLAKRLFELPPVGQQDCNCRECSRMD